MNYEQASKILNRHLLIKGELISGVFIENVFIDYSDKLNIGDRDNPRLLAKTDAFLEGGDLDVFVAIKENGRLTVLNISEYLGWVQEGLRHPSTPDKG